jgi:hypothetical protein
MPATAGVAQQGFACHRVDLMWLGTERQENMSADGYKSIRVSC